MIDSTDRERLHISKTEMYQMLAHDDLKKAGLLVFANKQDLEVCAFMSVCLSVCLSVVCLSVVCLSTCLSCLSMSVYLCLSVHCRAA